MRLFPVPRYVYLGISANTMIPPILLYLQHRGNRTKGNRKGKGKEERGKGKKKYVSAFAAQLECIETRSSHGAERP